MSHKKVFGAIVFGPIILLLTAWLLTASAAPTAGIPLTSAAPWREVSGSVVTAGEVVSYTFSADAGQVAAVDLRVDEGATLSGQITLWKASDGQRVEDAVYGPAANAFGPGNSAGLTAALPETGGYYIEIDAADSGDGATGAFTLRFNLVDPGANQVVDDDLADCPSAPTGFVRAAVRAAGPNGTVDVCAGAYTETQFIRMGQPGVTLSGAGPVDTRIASEDFATLHLTAAELTVENVDLRGGTSVIIGNSRTHGSDGFTLANCHMEGTVSALFLQPHVPADDVTVRNCSIQLQTPNFATDLYALFIPGDRTHVHDNAINTRSSDDHSYSRYGIMVTGNDVHVHDNEIGQSASQVNTEWAVQVNGDGALVEDNQIAGYRIGIRIQVDQALDSTATIRRNQLHGANVGVSATGILASTVDNAEVEANFISDYPGLSYGISLNSSGGHVVNNRVTVSGALGALNYIDSFDLAPPATFVNNTVANGLAGSSARGLYIHSDVGTVSTTLPVSVTNNLFSAQLTFNEWPNYCGVSANRPLQFLSHNIAGGYYTAWCTVEDAGSSNLVLAPGKSPGLADAQLHLEETSPAVDTGTSTGAPGTDFEQESRPANEAVDVGADKTFVPPAPFGGHDGEGELVRPDDVSDNFRAIVVDGSFAYVLGNQGTLLTYDISSLSRDGFQTLDSPRHTTTLENGSGLVQRGDTLFAYGLNGVQPIDLSDPAAPAPGAATGDAWIVNAEISGYYLVGAANGAVVVYRVDGGVPRLVESAPLPQGTRAYSVAVFEDVIIVRHSGANFEPAGYSTIRYSSLTSLGSPSRRGDAAVAYHQHRVGDRLVACTDSTLELWDASTPASPALLATTPLAQFGDGRLCIQDGDQIITNGTVHTVRGDLLELAGAFEPTYGQSDGFPYTGAANTAFTFVTQTPRILVLDRPGPFAALAAGVPGEGVDSAGETLEGAGAANVLYRDGAALSETGNEIWHQGTPDVAGRLEANDSFGRELAAGDFNGDGYPDVAVGAPDEDVEEDSGTLANAGAVNVIYGVRGGLSASASQTWHQKSPGIDRYAAAQNRFGEAVAAGDFNGDGYDDLAVGAPNTAVLSRENAGVVHVLYGSPSGITATGDTAWSQGLLDASRSEEGDRFGFSLATGDFDGDGYDDLAVGAPFERVDTIAEGGAVSVLFGSASGISAAGSQLWHQDQEYVPDQVEANDLFGWSLAAADMNGDGFDDLAVGVRQETIEDAGADKAGAVQVLFGYPAGLVGWGSRLFHQDSPGVAGRAEAADYFGDALAAADFDDDGYADVAIGAPWEDGEPPLANNGAVNVLYGTACGPSAGRDQLWDQDSEGIVGAAQSGDHFGDALAAGDLNGDGYADLAIGVPDETVSDQAGAGAANVLYGSAAGLTATGNQLWHQDRPGIAGAAEPGDRFGAALAVLNSGAPPVPDLPADILDPDAVGWRSGRNYSSAAFGDWFDEMKAQGFMIVDIETDKFDGKQRVGGVWQRNVDGRAWRETRDLTPSRWEELQEERRAAGYRLVDQEVYLLDGTPYYAGVWIENREDLAWDNFYDVSGSEFATLFDSYEAQGYMPVDFDAYVVDGQLLYSGIWVDNVYDVEWHEWRDMSSSGFGRRFDQYHSRFRMTDVESYYHGGEQYYAGIWVENRNRREWYERRDMSSKGFGEKWVELRDAGYRLVDYEVYPTADGWKYAGIWRQNGERHDWPLRCAVNALLEEAMDEYGIPGMSVAIAENGRWRYLRGLGYADIDDDVDADSRTIYRMASVSKPIAGVLAMRLVEDGLLNLTAPTRQYLPALADRHTHTVEQTLSNRSGIGHYSDYPNWKQWVDINLDGKPDHFDTATEAAIRLGAAPISYPPPGITYTYSTFAFTFAGASMERAAEKPADELLRDYLQLPFGLHTIRPERSVPDPNRSLLYANNSREEMAPDDLSWKLFGGGLESSAYDLARLGMGLLDYSILSSQTVTRLWTPVDSLRGYGLGWFTRNPNNGVWRVSHAGRQDGGASYIRIYPDEDIVIVLMSNRRDPSDPEDVHEIAGLGGQIGRLMLDEAYASITRQPLSPVVQQEEQIDEPDEEALPPEYVVWPESNPVAEVEDYTDPVEGNGQQQSPMGVLYLPTIIRK